MSLDQIYKTKIGESHEAGLKSVFDAGYAQGAADTEAAIESGVPAPAAPAPTEDSSSE